MTAVLVVLVIVACVAVDAVRLYAKRVPNRVIYEPGLGPCMADGAQENEPDSKSR